VAVDDRVRPDGLHLSGDPGEPAPVGVNVPPHASLSVARPYRLPVLEVPPDHTALPAAPDSLAAEQVGG
jgi:hypothetical protein